MATIAITPDHDTIEAEIFVAAPPERVFQALTDPSQMPRWWDRKACIASPSARRTFAPAENGPAWG